MSMQLKSGIPEGFGIVVCGFPRCHPDAFMTVEVTRGTKLAESTEYRPIEHEFEMITDFNAFGIV